MRMMLLRFIALLIMALSVQAENLQSTIDAQALEIKQLKRALSLKEQELKILLLTVKNAQHESMLHSNQPQLELNDVQNVSATRVVINPAMLSEAAIKAIDGPKETDTDSIERALNSENNDSSSEVAATKIEAAEGVDKMPKLSYTKPYKFLLTTDTYVYTKLFATEGIPWSKGMKFTSNQKRGNWIKITGKITEKGWKQVNAPLWVNENCVKKIQ